MPAPWKRVPCTGQSTMNKVYPFNISTLVNVKLYVPELGVNWCAPVMLSGTYVNMALWIFVIVVTHSSLSCVFTSSLAWSIVCFWSRWAVLITCKQIMRSFIFNKTMDVAETCVFSSTSGQIPTGILWRNIKFGVISCLSKNVIYNMGGSLRQHKVTKAQL